MFMREQADLLHVGVLVFLGKLTRMLNLVKFGGWGS